MSAGIGKDSRETFNEFLETLRRDRESLGVQLNPGKKELREEWRAVEEKWATLERQLEEFTEDATDAAQRMGHEIAETYRRMHDKLK